MKWIIRLILLGAALILILVVSVTGLPWLPVVGERLGAGPCRAHLAANDTVLNLDAEDAGLALAAAFDLSGEAGRAHPDRSKAPA